MSTKNSNGTIGNRTRDLLACGAVPQTNCATASPTFFRLVAIFYISTVVNLPFRKSKKKKLEASASTLVTDSKSPQKQ